MSVVRIRAGCASDLPALRSLYRRSSLSNPGDRDALLAHPEALELNRHAITQSRTQVAVGDDEKILGFITTRPLSRSALEIEDLFVDPDWMRQGVASRLVEHLVAAAGRSGVERLEVTANPHANAFYRHAGFTEDYQTATPFGPAPRMSLTLSGTEAAGDRSP